MRNSFTGTVLPRSLSVIAICLYVVRFSFNPPQIWSLYTSERLGGVIKKTEHCEDIKTNLMLIGQDIVIMSEGSELTNGFSQAPQLIQTQKRLAALKKDGAD